MKPKQPLNSPSKRELIVNICLSLIALIYIICIGFKEFLRIGYITLIKK